MRIKIMEIPDTVGSKLSFEFPLTEERLALPYLALPYIIGFVKAPVARGELVRKSDTLWVECEVNAELLCTCDRCNVEYKKVKHIKISVPVVEIEDGGEEEDPSFFYAEGGILELGELLEETFLLEMETRSLCKEDCKGLCPYCGVDLNHEKCSCRPPIDPRLAVLEQLLDDK